MLHLHALNLSSNLHQTFSRHQFDRLNMSLYTFDVSFSYWMGGWYVEIWLSEHIL